MKKYVFLFFIIKKVVEEEIIDDPLTNPISGTSGTQRLSSPPLIPTLPNPGLKTNSSPDVSADANKNKPLCKFYAKGHFMYSLVSLNYVILMKCKL